MDNQEFFNKSLPKWPGLLVIGKPVTKEQAMEIVLRTDRLDFSCNDREWSKQLNKIVYNVESTGRSINDAIKEQLGITDWNEQFEYQVKQKNLLNPLELDYLQNSQIASSWIGGAHGWCSWGGNIGEVFNEWTIIAEAFPFLDIRSQLLNCEVSGVDVEPMAVVEFVIKAGKVTMVEPQELIAMPSFSSASIMGRFTNPHAERGCMIEQFTTAYNLVTTKFAQEA